jgi:O-antigen ligase
MFGLTFWLLFALAIGILILRYEHAALMIFLGLAMGSLLLTAIPNGILKLKALLKQLHWWHVLWAFMILSGQVFRIRETTAITDNPLDPWALSRVALMSMVGLTLLYRLVIHHLDWIRSLGEGLIALLTGYSIVCLFSVLWSSYPLWTLYKSTEYLVDIALVAALISAVTTDRDLKTFFDWTWFLLGCLTASAWLGVIFWPDQAIVPGLGVLGFSIRGVFPAMETNGVGELGAIVGSICFARLLLRNTGRTLYVIGLLVAVVTLICSQSRSPLIGFLLATLVILFSSRSIGIGIFLPLLILSFLSLTSASDFLLEFVRRGESDEEFETLTGRTLLWDLGWQLFKQQPLIGYGAYAGARFTGISDTMATGNAGMLNAWLEILVGVGLLGCSFVLAAFGGVWFFLLKRALSGKYGNLGHHLTVEALGVLAIISVRSMFTAQLIWHPPVTFLLALGYAEFIRRQLKNEAYEGSFGSQLLPAIRR